MFPNWPKHFSRRTYPPHFRSFPSVPRDHSPIDAKGNILHRNADSSVSIEWEEDPVEVVTIPISSITRAGKFDHNHLGHTGFRHFGAFSGIFRHPFVAASSGIFRQRSASLFGKFPGIFQHFPAPTGIFRHFPHFTAFFGACVSVHFFAFFGDGVAEASSVAK